jgi:hypothetical protein
MQASWGCGAETGNIVALLGDNAGMLRGFPAWLLNNNRVQSNLSALIFLSDRERHQMFRLVSCSALMPYASAVFLALLLAAPVSAECFADYKAKRDAPLRLHYGVARIADQPCDRKSAERELRARLGSEHWQLLNIISTFGPEGLEERKASAGPYFLRY